MSYRVFYLVLRRIVCRACRFSRLRRAPATSHSAILCSSETMQAQTPIPTSRSVPFAESAFDFNLSIVLRRQQNERSFMYRPSLGRVLLSAQHMDWMVTKPEESVYVALFFGLDAR